MEQKKKYQEALSRAAGGLTMSNYPTIINGFIQKGIPEDQIEPRKNVFTYDAWKALGRYVKKGEHGVRVVTFLKVEKKEVDEQTGKEVSRVNSRPWMTTVFHVTQTEAINP